MTNAEWLRKLSDVELAEFLCYLRYGKEGSCNGCVAEGLCETGCNGMTIWVKQEYTEND